MSNAQGANKNKKHTATVPFFKKYLYDVIVIAFSLVIYINSVPNDYNMDDELVTINHRLTSKGVSAIPEIFTSPYYADESGYKYEYRPVVLVSFAIEHTIFGDNAFISHFFNWLLYALCIWLLYRLLTKIAPDLPAIVVTGICLLFAAHPSHTEVVCSIKNRDEILGLIFGFAACWFAFKAMDTKSYWLSLAGVCLLLSFMCKITFISFTVIIPLLVLLLFTNVNIRQFLLLLLSLLIPAYLMLDMGSFYTKAIVLMGIIATNFIFLFITRTAIVLDIAQGFRQPIKTIKQEMLNDLPLPALPINYKNLIAGLIPPSTYFSPLSLLLAVTTLALYYCALAWQNRLLILVIPVLLLIFSHSEKLLLQYWAKVGLYSCLTLGTVYIFRTNSHSITQEILIAFIIPVLLHEFLWGKAGLKLPLLFLAIFTIIPWGGNSRFDVFNLLLTLLLFLFMLHPKGKYGIWAVTLVTCIYIGHQLWKYPIGQLNINNIQISPYTRLIVALCFIFFKKTPRLIVYVYVMLAICAIGYLSSGKNINAQNEIESAATLIDANIYKVKADRPLSYIENPVVLEPSQSMRVGTSLSIMLIYLQKVAVPYPLAFYYGYSFVKPTPVTATVAIISLILHLLLVALGFFTLRNNKMISAGIWIYLISASIYSNYFIPPPGVIADRFLLVPSLGFSIVLVMGPIAIWNHFKPLGPITWHSLPKPLKTGFIVGLSIYSIVTFSRNFDWKDHITLMRKDIGYVKESAQGQNLLALNLMKYSLTLGRVEEQQPLWKEAIEHFRKSLEIYPGTFNVAYDLGRVHSMLNQPDSSFYYFTLANRIDPKNDLPQLKMNIAMLYQQKGLNDSALAYYLEYNRLLPTDFQGYDKLGYQYFIMGRKNMALEISKKATVNLPQDYRSYFNVARSYVELNLPDSALIYLYQAQKLNPNDQNINQSIKSMEARYNKRL